MTATALESKKVSHRALRDAARSDPATIELASLSREIDRLRNKISRFRQTHEAHRGTRAKGCALCAYLYPNADYSGLDLFDSLTMIHSALASGGGMIDNDRPYTAEEWRCIDAKFLAEFNAKRALRGEQKQE